MFDRPEQTQVAQQDKWNEPWQDGPVDPTETGPLDAQVLRIIHLTHYKRDVKD
jgi:hypothetical protein